jgi:hypothetical protein
MTSAHLASRELASVSGVVPIKMRRDDLFTKEDFEALVTVFHKSNVNAALN